MCPIGLVARFAICFADGRVQAQVAAQPVFGIAPRTSSTWLSGTG
jgi:hypothetical protein